MRRAVAIGGLSLAGVVGLLLLAFVVLLGTGTLKAYAIPSSAMEPTLHCARPDPGCEGVTNDRVLVLERFVSYERGDLVVFDAPAEAVRRCEVGGMHVKRIVGLPGEKVELRVVGDEYHVYIDAKPLAEPYAGDAPRASAVRVVNALLGDEYFVLGDNRAQSCDSSVWGPLPAGDVEGKIVGTYWPPDRWTIR
jgi:signal peptidase I